MNDSFDMSGAFAVGQWMDAYITIFRELLEVEGQGNIDKVMRVRQLFDHEYEKEVSKNDLGPWQDLLLSTDCID